MSLDCPATGKVINESNIKGNKRLEEFGNKLVDEISKAVHGEIPEVEIRNRMREELSRISLLEKTGLAELEMTTSSEEALNTFAKTMIMSNKAIGSASFSDFSKQAGEIFTQMKSHIDSKTKIGYLRTVSDIVRNLTNDINYYSHKSFENLRVKVGDVLLDPIDALKTGDGKAEMDLYNDTIRGNGNINKIENPTPAQRVMYKQAIKDRAMIEKNIKYDSPEEFEMIIASMSFDNKALMGLRKRPDKINRIYDLFLGHERSRVTLEERNSAFEVFKTKYSDTFKNLKEPEHLERIFNYLGDYDSFENGIDLFNEKGRSLLSSYQKLKNIMDGFEDEINVEELLKVANDFKKSPEELLRHNVAGAAKLKVVSGRFGIVPRKTLDEVSKLADTHIPGGVEKDAFNKNISIYEEAVEAAFFPNKEIFLSSAPYKVFLELGYIPISKSLALMSAGRRHLFESTTALNKMVAIDGKINPNNFKTVFGRAMLNAEGMMMRETLNTLGTLPGFKAYNKQIEKIAEFLDFSGLSKIPLDVQMKYVEGLEATMCNIHTYAGVIDTRRSMKSTEGVFGKTGAFLSQFALLTPLDQFAGIMSSQHTQVYMDSIVKNFDNALSNPALKKKLERYGVTKEDAELLKIMLDSQGEDRWKPFKRKDYMNSKVNDFVAKKLIPKTPNDLTFANKADYNNHLVDIEMNKLVSFNIDNEARVSDFLKTNFDTLIEKNIPLAKFDSEKFDFSKNVKTGELKVSFDRKDSLMTTLQINKMEENLTLEINKIITAKRKNLNLEIRKKEPEFKNIVEFLEEKYNVDEEAAIKDTNRLKDTMLKRIMDFEGHLFQHLGAPKPNLEMDIALRNLDKNAHAMFTTNLLMKNKMQFMSTVTSIVQQAGTVVDDFGSHIDKGNRGFNTENAKLFANAGSSLLLSAAYMGLMNNIKDQIATGEGDFTYKGVASKALTDDILVSAVGSYVNRYDSFSSKFAYEMLTSKNKGNVIWKVAEKNPILYNNITKMAMKQLSE